jgi:hypothetical protein
MQNSFEWMLIVGFGVATMFLFLIYYMTLGSGENNWLAVALFFGGFFLNTIVILVKNKITEPSRSIGLYDEFEKDIEEKIGVVQIYPKRRDSDNDGYLHDLGEDFGNNKKLQKSHTGKDRPIKILSLALDDDLLTANIQRAIISNCSNIGFHILISEEKNRELESRLKFANGKFEKLTKNRDWKCETFKDTPLFLALTAARTKINELRINNSYIETRQYSFSPFATIVIINDHIYYTPNVIAFSNYVKQERLPGECTQYIYDAELSLRIQRDSEFGRRLEKLFESLWENRENTEYTPS